MTCHMCGSFESESREREMHAHVTLILCCACLSLLMRKLMDTYEFVDYCAVLDFKATVEASDERVSLTKFRELNKLATNVSRDLHDATMSMCRDLSVYEDASNG
jgi:hypothetical protein